MVTMGFFGVGAAMGLAALVVVVGSIGAAGLVGVGGLILNVSLGSVSMA
jgi:hypothetical protein